MPEKKKDSRLEKIGASGYNKPVRTKGLLISGSNTTLQVSRAIKELEEKEISTVFMYGPGGLYYAGLRLGEAIKEANVRVIIPKGKRCVSACAFASLGGREVLSDGEVWFHVPFRQGVSTNKTLMELGREDGVAFLDMTEYLAKVTEDSKWAFEFSKRLLRQTSYCKFLTKTDSDAAYKLINKCG